MTCARLHREALSTPIEISSLPAGSLSVQVQMAGKKLDDLFELRPGEVLRVRANFVRNEFEILVPPIATDTPASKINERRARDDWKEKRSSIRETNE